MLLVDEISTGRVKPLPSIAPHHVYLRDQRPRLLGFLDWTLSVEQLSALFRSCFANGFRNRFAQPKVLTPTGAVVVQAANFHTVAPTLHPGQVAEVADSGLRIACADGLVEVTRITDLSGQSIEFRTLEIAQGDTLPALDASVVDLFVQDDVTLMADHRWLAELREFAPTPFSALTEQDGSIQSSAPQWRQVIASETSFAELTAATALVLGRVNETERCGMLLSSGRLLDLHRRSGGFLSRTVPVSLSLVNTIKVLSSISAS